MFSWTEARDKVSEILYKWGRFLLDNGQYKTGLLRFWQIYNKFPKSRWFQPVFEELIAREQPKDMVFVHDKNIPPYFIDIHPVTNKKYFSFLKDTNYPAPHHWKGNMYPIGKGNHPVTWVSLEDAKKYAQWENKRLPSEKEWQQAAQGPEKTNWPWGNNYEIKRCNCAENQINDTSPVKQYDRGKSYYECYDMAGNVWEWTNSWYTNEQSYKVLKGGSWYTHKEFLSTEYRYFDVPFRATGLYGFRCAKSFIQ